MKRALAERAKQQKELRAAEAANHFMQQQQQQQQQQQEQTNVGTSGGSGNSGLSSDGGTPLTLSSMSTMGSISASANHNAMHSSPSHHHRMNSNSSNVMKHKRQPEEDKGQSSTPNRDMRVEITSQPPPRKIPRIKSSMDSPRTPPVGIQSNSTASTTSTTKKNKQNGSRSTSGGSNKSGSTSSNVKSSLTNPKKRSRPSSIGSSTPSALNSPLPLPTGGDDDEEENDSKNTRFYLKHQNSALASELYRYKHAISVLEAERKVRRDECRQINDALNDMVSYWDGMEGILVETFGGSSIGSDRKSKSLPQSLASMGPATSTGKGKDVEHVYNIMESIIKLSKSSTMFQLDDNPEIVGSTNLQENNGDIYQSESITEQKFLKHLSDATSSFSNRVANFQKLLVNLVQHYICQYSNSSSSGDKQSKKFMNQVIELGSLTQQISELQNKCEQLEGQIEDLSKDRDNAKNNERRVRRCLYRVSTGRMKIAEAIKAVEESSSLGVKDLEDLQKDLLSSSKHHRDFKGENDANGSNGSTDENNTESKAITIDGKTLGIDDVMEMKKKIDDLGLRTEFKEKKIMELITEKENLELKINNLLDEATKKAKVDDEDIKASSLFIETMSKLSTAEDEKQKLRDELKSVNERWAITKGNLEQSKKTVDTLEDKHKRRLKELTGAMEDGPDSEALHEEIDNAKRAVLLEHKLKHALDNVRQAEAMKTSLVDAISMKDSLLRQINELKSRNEELEASQESYRDNLMKSENGSDANAATNEKIHRLKKELGSAMHSKDQAKRTLEKFAKERESLMSMNTRLQEQSMEKDDMNAKSLSTILHLKQLSEQLEQEKGILEKRLKSAEQLAVMARLASNAKEKVEREAMHEKEIAEQESKQLKSSYEELKKQNNETQTELSVSKLHVLKVEKDLQSMTDRCNELVSTSTMKEKEIKKLSEELVVAKKDAVEAMQKAAASTAASSSNKISSGFTAEQLTIQVNLLKGRLTCPVCGVREKDVINTRCRHMFCRQCINLNLENRNRKCPTCGIRFDKKDIDSIYF